MTAPNLTTGSRPALADAPAPGGALGDYPDLATGVVPGPGWRQAAAGARA